MSPFSIGFKIIFHKHLEKIETVALWRWFKGLVIAAGMLIVIPDCIPFLDELTLTWMATSVLWELTSRGEIQGKWLPETIRKRLPAKRVVDVEPS